MRHRIKVPGDKSISHRAVLLASISDGPCLIRGFLPSADCLRTVAAVRSLGIAVDCVGPTTLVVHGKQGVFTQPKGDIDCGNSGTTMRLLAGLLASQPFCSRLVGDSSLSNRPMQRVIDPLTQMGAKIRSEGNNGRPPLIIQGANLRPIRHVLRVASAQVKSALLLAGLSARGITSVTEPMQSRDHMERMLEHFGIHIEKIDSTVSLTGPRTAAARAVDVPGDLSSAAFWLVAAGACPGSDLLIEDVGLNPTRSGVVAVLTRMGAEIRQVIQNAEGEPSGFLSVRGRPLKATMIGGTEIPNLIDELPVLAVAAALADGRTVIADASELRVKETDRITAIATNLRAMGAQVYDLPDGLEIIGGWPLRGARVNSYGDHRVAMACAVAALFADGVTTVVDTDCVATSYPGFQDRLRLRANSPVA